MSVNSSKKSLFKRIVNIILAVLMGIVAFISVSVFALACIGSCSSKTATVKADNEILFYSDGNYFTPMSNFYLSASGLTMIPNKDSTQSFILGSDIVIARRYVESGYNTYVPTLCVRSSFPLSSEWLNYKYHYNGREGVFDDNVLVYNGTSYRHLNFIGIDIDDATYGNVTSAFYYGVTSTYPSTFYSCIQFTSSIYFNNDVVRISYSSAVVDTIDGYASSCIRNSVTYHDRNNYTFTVNFYCANSWGSSPVSSVLWEERSYYVDLQQGSYNQGYDDGYDEGFKDGEENGNAGYQNGYDDGFDDGKEVGKDEGYEEGYRDGSNNELTSANFFRKVLSIFDVPIFGFISLGDIFKFIFVIAMGIWALKLFAGG